MNVEIGHYKPVNKGCVKASFSLAIYPIKFKINDCTWFEKDGRQWISFPQKEYIKKGEEKKSYFPYLEIVDKDVLIALQNITIEALKIKESNEKSNPGTQNSTSKVQTQSPSLPF